MYRAFFRVVVRGSHPERPGRDPGQAGLAGRVAAAGELLIVSDCVHDSPALAGPWLPQPASSHRSYPR